jgi:Fe-S cluster assembly protein SufD
MRASVKDNGAVEALARSLESVAPHLPGRERSLAGRRAALARLARTGLPGRRTEEWKYTDLAGRLTVVPPQVARPGPLSQAELDAALGTLAGLGLPRLVFVDGWHVPELSQGEQLTTGGRADHGPATPSRDGFREALLALATDGASVDFAPPAATARSGARTRTAKPARRALMIVAASTGATPSSAFVNHSIDVSAGEPVEIVEVVLQLGQAHRLVGSELSLRIAEGARVEHVRVIGDCSAGPAIVRCEATIGARASYVMRQLTSGTAFCRNEAGITFTGEGATFDLKAVSLARGDEHADTTLVIDHAVPRCTSREHYKAVLGGEARCVFQGKVIVRPDAQKTDGKQKAQGLLLSPSAEFLSKPELEIFADDVTCGHGSTSTELDHDHLFYLRSRGIGDAEARAMLTEAFIAETLEEIGNEGVRDGLRARARDWLAKGVA